MLGFSEIELSLLETKLTELVGLARPVISFFEGFNGDYGPSDSMVSNRTGLSTIFPAPIFVPYFFFFSDFLDDVTSSTGSSSSSVSPCSYSDFSEFDTDEFDDELESLSTLSNLFLSTLTSFPGLLSI